MRGWLYFIVLGFLLNCGLARAKDFRGTQFFGFTEFTTFQRELRQGALVLVSPQIHSEIAWEELVASWNSSGATNSALKVEVRVIYPSHESAWYCLGNWGTTARESVRGQSDNDGRVDTDVLKLKVPAKSMQVRIAMPGITNHSAIRFLGLSLCDTQRNHLPLEPNRTVWGKNLDVPELSQTAYPEGITEWCSPTSTAMLLDFWAAKLNRTDLHHDVPAAARAVNDPNWPGTGNWSFNMAFAGAHTGIRAYVARLTDVSELEDWIETGVPVAASVAYGYLKGELERANGHLVVCIGFDREGNIIVNDPGRRNVRQIYTRENFTKAWAESNKTVYLVHPEDWKVPVNLRGHWHSN